MSQGDSADESVHSTISEAVPRSVRQWIVDAHYEWSGVTLSSFFAAAARDTLTDEQWRAFAADLAHASSAVARLQVSELSDVASADAIWFSRPAARRPPSSAARRLASAVDSTEPGLPALVAAWTHLCSSWQAWANAGDRGRLPRRYANVAKHVCRSVANDTVLNAQERLDEALRDAAQSDLEQARTAFYNVLRFTAAVLNAVVVIGDDDADKICRCGRKGHLELNCTFKSRI